MQITQAQIAGMRTQALFELEQNWRRVLIPSQSQRNWLAGAVAEAIYVESYEHVGVEKGGSARRKFVAAVCDRVKARNENPSAVAAYSEATGDRVGESSVLLTIILGAVLSWLIGRLLDWYFPQAAGLTSSPCETCNCSFGVQTMAGWKTYIVSGGMIVYAVAGMLLGKVDPATAIATIMTALGLSSVASDSKNDAKTVVQKLK